MPKPDLTLNAPYGELPPALCEAAFMEFNDSGFSLETAKPKCSMDQLDPALIRVASELYKRYPYVVNCAYRSVEWDKSKGRSGLSSHCKGLAMDIKTPNHRDRLHLVNHLLQLGVKRIGIAATFIHFDLDSSKPASIWLYHPNNLNKTF